MDKAKIGDTEELCAVPTTGDEIGKISTTALKTMLQSKVKLTLIDARTPKWDDGQRIPGALSLTSEDPIEKIQTVLPQKNALIVAYCSNLQCGASDRLIKRLQELNYPFILKYPEGIEEWINKGNSVTKSK